jgi:hypothetical protein
LADFGCDQCRGKKVNPAEVEAHLLRFSGVRQAVVFGARLDLAE